MEQIVLIMKKNNEKTLVLKEREVSDVLQTIENLTRHVKRLLNEIKYLEVNS